MRHRGKPNAFTLIELLVVVAIIVALIAILLPSMGKAIAVAERAQCGSQLKQIGLGFAAYHADHRLMFLTQNNASQMTYGGHPGTYTNYRDADGYGTDDRPLNRYTGLAGVEDGDADAPLYRCPTDNGAPGWNASSVSTYEDVGTSYLYNRWAPAAGQAGTLNPNPIVNTSTSITTVKVPAMTILSAGHPLFNFQSNGDRLQRWHDDTKPTANIAYLDGHVGYVDVQPSVTGDTVDYTWYPDGPKF